MLFPVSGAMGHFCKVPDQADIFLIECIFDNFLSYFTVMVGEDKKAIEIKRAVALLL